MPTQLGKTFCYILLFDYLRIVILPLHNLMVDQVDKYSSKGLKRTYIQLKPW